MVFVAFQLTFAIITPALITGSTADRWKFGEQIAPGGIRDLADPPTHGQPDRMTSSLYWGSPVDAYGVHTNSGVGNKAASLIADGGAFNGQAITGIGLDATALIYDQAETTLLGPGSDYRDLYDILPQACRALLGHGTTAFACDQVDKAVTATEMNLAPVAPGSRLTAAVCDAGTHQGSVVFTTDMETDPGAFTFAADVANARWRYIVGSSQSGVRSLYAPDLAGTAFATATMTSPVVIPAGATTYLRFEHSFSFDELNGLGYDGGVVEYRGPPTGEWADAGLLPGTVNGYTTSLSTVSDNVLAGRQAFSGMSPGYQQTRIDLSSLGGQSIVVRFALGSDRVVGDYGWFVDDVSIYTCLPGDPPGTTRTIDVAAVAAAPARRL